MLAAHKVDDALHLVVGDEAALHARGLARALRRVEHVALAQQLLRTTRVEDGSAVDLAGHRERDAAGDVRLDDAGNDVDRRALRRDDQMNARCARQLRQAADRFLDLARGDHHQVGQLVDDDDDLAHRLLIRADRVVVALDVAHAHRLKALVAVLHLHHGPRERRGSLLRVGDDRHQQVRDAVVHRQLDDLRVDQDQPDLPGGGAVDDRVDDRIDAHGLAGARRARDEHVRHLRHVRDDRRAGNALAQRHGRRGFLAHHLRALQHVAQGNRLDLLVRNLDADRRLAGDRRLDAHAVGGHVQRDVVHQVHDARNLHARGRLQLVARDGRAVRDVRQLRLHAEALQRREQLARARLNLRIQVRVLRAAGPVEQIDRWEDIRRALDLRRLVRILLGQHQRRAVRPRAAQLHNRVIPGRRLLRSQHILNPRHISVGRSLRRRDGARQRRGACAVARTDHVRRRFVHRRAANRRPVCRHIRLILRLVCVAHDHVVVLRRLVVLDHHVRIRLPERHVVLRLVLRFDRLRLFLRRRRFRGLNRLPRPGRRFLGVRDFLSLRCICRGLRAVRLCFRLICRLLRRGGARAVHAVEECVLRLLHRKAVPASRAVRLGARLDALTGEFVVPLDVQRHILADRRAPRLRRGPLGGLPLGARRLNRRHILRRGFCLHHLQRRPGLALAGGLLRLRLRIICRRLFLLPGVKRSLRLGFRALLFGGRLTLALNAPRLALLGQFRLPAKRLLLALLTQRRTLLPLLAVGRAQVIQQLAQVHSHAAEGHAGQHHQHDCAGKDQHDHRAPNVQRLVQRPGQQRADQAAALAGEHRAFVRAQQERAVGRRLPVGKDCGGHRADLKELHERLDKQEQQRAADHGAQAHPSAGKEHQRHAHPAQHHRQQQTQRAAQTTGQHRRAVEQPAAGRDELADERQQAHAQDDDARHAARIDAALLLSAPRRAALAAHLSLAFCALGRRLFGHFPSSRIQQRDIVSDIAVSTTKQSA